MFIHYTASFLILLSLNQKWAIYILSFHIGEMLGETAIPVRGVHSRSDIHILQCLEAIHYYEIKTVWAQPIRAQYLVRSGPMRVHHSAGILGGQQEGGGLLGCQVWLPLWCLTSRKLIKPEYNSHQSDPAGILNIFQPIEMKYVCK